MSRCGYYKHTDGKKYFIPGCLSGWYNERDCTCYKPVTKAKKEQTVDNLESECYQLRAINEKLNNKCKKLEQENFQLLRRGLPLYLRRKLEGDKIYLWMFLKKLIE